MSHPLDNCMLFMPDPDGRPGHYHYHTGFGWADCDQKQDALLHANRHLHVAAGALRDLDHPEDEGRAWGAMKAFKTFVMPGLTRQGVRCCSRCRLPGHTKRTCTLDSAGDWVIPEGL